MRLLYIDCSMGAAGDMLTGALAELFPDVDRIISELNSLGVPGVCYERESSVKCGINGTYIRVRVNGVEEDENLHSEGSSHHHSSLADIEGIVSHLNLKESVKQDICKVYGLIAEAESQVHGVPVSDIHFHEVGRMDAIADIAAVSFLMDRLSVGKVIVSPVHVGSGLVRCAHGLLPVPAPATAYILNDCPVYGGDIKGELCTPTGAALLKYFADDFGSLPPMMISGTGYGMGKKDFEAANCVRVFLGESTAGGETVEDSVTEMVCNIDDMTGEELAFALEMLMSEGALDVYTVAACMKKGRPGQVLHVLCRNADRERMAHCIFMHTKTIGIRFSSMERYILDRHTEEIKTGSGVVHQKVSSGFGVERRKTEYDDLAGIAIKNGISLDEARASIEKGSSSAPV